jgi:hypothetical protein
MRVCGCGGGIATHGRQLSASPIMSPRSRRGLCLLYYVQSQIEFLTAIIINFVLYSDKWCTCAHSASWQRMENHKFNRFAMMASAGLFAAM